MQKLLNKQTVCLNFSTTYALPVYLGVFFILVDNINTAGRCLHNQIGLYNKRVPKMIYRLYRESQYRTSFLFEPFLHTIQYTNSNKHLIMHLSIRNATMHMHENVYCTHKFTMTRNYRRSQKRKRLLLGQNEFESILKIRLITRRVFND